MTGGVALLEDGRVLYAIHEERLNRAKMATGFPSESIKKVLEDTGTRPEEIGAIILARFGGLLDRVDSLLVALVIAVVLS